MAILTIRTISAGGTIPTYAAASGGGDKIKAGPRNFLHVKNAGGGSVTVTVNDTKTPTPTGAASFNPDLAVVIAPSSEKFIGPLPATRFGDNAGDANVTYSGVTSVTVAALKI